jgi:hypothetical protein
VLKDHRQRSKKPAFTPRRGPCPANCQTRNVVRIGKFAVERLISSPARVAFLPSRDSLIHNRRQLHPLLTQLASGCSVQGVVLGRLVRDKCSGPDARCWFCGSLILSIVRGTL